MSDWRTHLSVESLKAMDANDPISPATVLPLAVAFETERERCARIVEEYFGNDSTDGLKVAALIRNRAT
jgi:hypothetical protein